MKRYLSITILLSVIVSCTETAVQDKGELKSKEKFRPYIHFTPPSMWMNDPNGMVYYEGEYHLFYQHYPDSTVWGPMHWGHAVSKDLVKWEHLPIALYPDSLGLIFSGSAVIDWNNTSGLGTVGNPPMVAIYSYHNMEGERSGAIDYQTQGIAFSTDKGRTWEKYEGNPVIANPGIRDFRDPKVVWDEASEKWIMALAVFDHVAFYSSANLIDWQHESDFGLGIGNHDGVWECPDLFNMNVENSEVEKWVLIVSTNPGGPNGGSATQYFVGEFDGSAFSIDPSFTPDFGDGQWIDYGSDNYAGVTWSDIPEEDGRRLFIGWMSNWEYANVVPTENWRSAMTVSRKMELYKDGEEYKIRSVPVKEYEAYKTETSQYDELLIEDEFIIDGIETNTAYTIDLSIDEINTSELQFIFTNDSDEQFITTYMIDSGKLVTDRSKSGLVDFQEGFAALDYAPIDAMSEMDIEFVIDEASAEVFINDGEKVITTIFFPSSMYNKLVISSTNGSVKISEATVYSIDLNK